MKIQPAKSTLWRELSNIYPTKSINIINNKSTSNNLWKRLKNLGNEQVNTWKIMKFLWDSARQFMIPKWKKEPRQGRKKYTLRIGNNFCIKRWNIKYFTGRTFYSWLTMYNSLPLIKTSPNVKIFKTRLRKMNFRKYTQILFNLI